MRTPIQKILFGSPETGKSFKIDHEIIPNQLGKEVLKLPVSIGKFSVQEGVATDTETGLMWLRFPYGKTWQNNTVIGDAKKVDWTTAFEVAKQFNEKGGYADFTDWRLPTIDELKTLIDKENSIKGHYIDRNVFVTKPRGGFWSSSPAGNGYLALFMNFYYGSVNCNNKLSSLSVRLVRAGQ